MNTAVCHIQTYKYSATTMTGLLTKELSVPGYAFSKR